MKSTMHHLKLWLSIVLLSSLESLLMTDECPDSDSMSETIHRYQVQGNDGRYKFGFSETSGQYRIEESDGEGGVLGSYGYVDSNCLQVRVYYRAGVEGFQIINREIYLRLKQQLRHGQPPSISQRPSASHAVHGDLYHHQQQQRPQLESNYVDYPQYLPRQPQLYYWPYLPRQPASNVYHVVAHGHRPYPLMVTV